MMTRAVLLALSLCSLQAATIELRLGTVRGSELADTLLAPLAHEQGVCMAALQAWGRQVQVYWAKRKQPPFTRVVGYPGDEIARRLRLEGRPVPCAWGPAWSLPRLPGYGCHIAADGSSVIAPLTGLAAPAAFTWWQVGPDVARFVAGPADMKLEGLEAYLVELDLRWRQDDLLVVELRGEDADGAADIRSWLLNRKPLLDIAVAFGIDDAVFFARLLDGSHRQLDGDVYRISRHVDAELRATILAFLARQIEDQIEDHRSDVDD